MANNVDAKIQKLLKEIDRIDDKSQSLTSMRNAIEQDLYDAFKFKTKGLAPCPFCDGEVFMIPIELSIYKETVFRCTNPMCNAYIRFTDGTSGWKEKFPKSEYSITTFNTRPTDYQKAKQT